MLLSACTNLHIIFVINDKLFVVIKMRGEGRENEVERGTEGEWQKRMEGRHSLEWKVVKKKRRNARRK
jgi:hypothetical protein